MTFKLTAYGQTIMIDRYMICDNQWGIADAGTDPFHQTVSGNETLPLSLSWEWDWPLGKDKVKAYPEILCGYNPWQHATTWDKLPKQVSAVGDYIINYDLKTEAGESYNTAVDMFTTSTNPPTPTTITNEIMIWVNFSEDTVANVVYGGTVTIDGEEYRWVRYPHMPAAHDYVAFHKVRQNFKGTLHIRSFLDWLVGQGFTVTGDYVASIEFGNEIFHGIGQTTVNHYDLSYEEKKVKGTFVVPFDRNGIPGNPDLSNGEGSGYSRVGHVPQSNRNIVIVNTSPAGIEAMKLLSDCLCIDEVGTVKPVDSAIVKAYLTTNPGVLTAKEIDDAKITTAEEMRAIVVKAYGVKQVEYAKSTTLSAGTAEIREVK
jgi:hypothetical protein